jgi:hypothetical protein
MHGDEEFSRFYDPAPFIVADARSKDSSPERVDAFDLDEG